MADNKINGGIEIIGHTFEHCNFRFNVVVFIFVNRGLTDLNRVGKRLLADVVFLAKQFQIGKHAHHPFLMNSLTT